MILRFLSISFLFASVLDGCVRTIPPEEYYPTSSLPPNEATTQSTEAPGEETTTVVTEATTAGGGGACVCNDLPPAVTQVFLDNRIKDQIANVELPETWEPGLINCGMSIMCLYNVADSALESNFYFLVTAATDGGEDVITLFQNSQLICSNGKFTNGGKEIIGLGCYGVLK